MSGAGAAIARKGRSRLRLVLIVAIVVGGFLLSQSGESNLDHQTGAGGILTMQQCMECHSKGSKKPISVCLDNHCLYTRNHPMMHNYPPPGRENKFAGMHEILQAGCILEDGKVTCLSCHDLTKPAPHLIRSGDALCLICHKELRP